MSRAGVAVEWAGGPRPGGRDGVEFVAVRLAVGVVHGLEVAEVEPGQERRCAGDEAGVDVGEKTTSVG
jgi:hypothetical protein